MYKKKLTNSGIFSEMGYFKYFLHQPLIPINLLLQRDCTSDGVEIFITDISVLVQCRVGLFRCEKLYERVIGEWVTQIRNVEGYFSTSDD